VGKVLKTILSWVASIILVCILIVMVVGTAAINIGFGNEWVVWLMAIGIGLSIIAGAFTPRGWRNRMRQRRAVQPSSPTVQSSPVTEHGASPEELKERLANGEITIQEYRQIRAALEKE